MTDDFDRLYEKEYARLKVEYERGEAKYEEMVFNHTSISHLSEFSVT